jgi:hypothetical protein
MRYRWPHIVGFLVAAAMFVPGQNISFDAQWPLYESLRTTASIILAIVGAWMGLIYPKALEKLLDKSVPSTDSAPIEHRRLLEPLLYSTGILIAVLLIGVSKPILSQWNIVLAHQEIARGVSFSVLIYLTLLQILTLLLTLAPASMTKDQFTLLQKRKERIDGLQSLKRRVL